MIEPWHKRRPEEVDAIRKDLQERYQHLHLFIEGEKSEVRGTFPVLSPSGETLDQFSVVIELPRNYSRDLPIVREVGGRIPWKIEFHIEHDGKACVLLPDARWSSFPEGAPFRQFIEGPMHNFFLGQCLVALGEKWPFDEWKHGRDGVYQYYAELLGDVGRDVIHAHLHVLSKRNLKLHFQCPCGSQRRIRDCCQARIVELRLKIPWTIARTTLVTLGLREIPTQVFTVQE